ncbi:MAG: hypothetical protein M0R75_02840 [Dehalococcoidia bacterium]|nr:hypothetical protein [Dehalococcoidia bacterium]
MKPTARPRHRAWPDAAAEVAYFRDSADTWFAAEVVRSSRWHERLLEPLDPGEVDIRIAFLDDMPELTRSVARSASTACAVGVARPWLRVLPASAEREPRLVVEAALDAWEHSDSFRGPGASAEAYLLAAYQALCPPHPPCEAGPGMRDTLVEFLEGRTGPLGRLTELAPDAVNRLVRISWPTPEDFADAVLRERIGDDGGRGVLELVGYLEAAEVPRDVEAYAGLAMEREHLLTRLPPIAYFTQPADYDRAAALALDWRERYARAYQAHYRAVLEAAREVVVDTAPATRLLAELEAMNLTSTGTPVGLDAARRLRGALDDLARLPEGVDAPSPQTAGLALGRMPYAIAEARLSAAAVLAAVEVHRRRLA